MKKSLKYLIAVILSIFTVACMCAALSACKKSGGDGSNTNNENTGSLYGRWDEYDGVKVGFVDENAFNQGDIDESKILPELNSKLDEKWYMIIDFDIQAPYDNDGRETVTAELKIQPAVAVKATIQDTNSGNVSEKTENDITELKATYKIPEKAETVRNMRLVIKIDALKTSEVYFDISFISDMQDVKTKKVESVAVIGDFKELKFSGGTVFGVNNKEVEDILIPVMKNRNYITSISRNAFWGCSGLKSVSIPNSVTSIGNFAFRECSGLKSIIYSGTKYQWRGIKKDVGWKYEADYYTVHCTDGDLTKGES